MNQLTNFLCLSFSQIQFCMVSTINNLPHDLDVLENDLFRINSTNNLTIDQFQQSSNIYFGIFVGMCILLLLSTLVFIIYGEKFFYFLLGSYLLFTINVLVTYIVLNPASEFDVNIEKPSSDLIESYKTKVTSLKTTLKKLEADADSIKDQKKALLKQRRDLFNKLKTYQTTSSVQNDFSVSSDNSAKVSQALEEQITSLSSGSIRDFNLTRRQLNEILLYLQNNPSISSADLSSYVLDNYPSIGISDIQFILLTLISKYQNAVDEVNLTVKIAKENEKATLDKRLLDLDSTQRSLQTNNQVSTFGFSKNFLNLFNGIEFLYRIPNRDRQIISSNISFFDNNILYSIGTNNLDFFIRSLRATFGTETKGSLPLSFSRNAMYGLSGIRTGTISGKTLLNSQVFSSSGDQTSLQYSITPVLQGTKTVAFLFKSDVLYPIANSAGEYGFYIVPNGFQVLVFKYAGRIFVAYFNSKGDIICIQNDNGIVQLFPAHAESTNDLTSFPDAVLSINSNPLNLFTGQILLSIRDGFFTSISPFVTTDSDRDLFLQSSNSSLQVSGIGIIKKISPNKIPNQQGKLSGYVAPYYSGSSNFQSQIINSINASSAKPTNTLQQKLSQIAILGEIESHSLSLLPFQFSLPRYFAVNSSFTSGVITTTFFGPISISSTQRYPLVASSAAQSVAVTSNIPSIDPTANLSYSGFSCQTSFYPTTIKFPKQQEGMDQTTVLSMLFKIVNILSQQQDVSIQITVNSSGDDSTASVQTSTGSIDIVLTNIDLTNNSENLNLGN